MDDSIVNILANDNYIIVNKTLIKKIGLKESILLGELAAEYNYYKKNELLDEEGYFYSTIENVEENTSLSKYEQKKALDSLEMLNVIFTKIKGIPATRHIKLNNYQLANLLANNFTSSCQKISKLDGEKFTTNNNKEIIINNNNKNINIIVDYLNLKANTNYKSTTTKTQTLINTRLKEGFTEEDFKTVIDKKCEEWLHTDYEKFLRPETLFSNKFESYLNQNIIKQKKKESMDDIIERILKKDD